MQYHIVPVTHYMQNCSILVCPQTNKAAFVDPGGDIEKLKTKIADLNVIPEKIFLTHGHMDHVSAAKGLSEFYNIPIEGSHKGDAMIFETLPLWCQQAGFPHTDAFEPDRWLQEGDIVEFGQQRLDVLFCPGHTPGHVVFLHRDIGVAWVGDVLFQGSIGRTDFPGGNHQQLLHSIREKLWQVGDNVKFVPGHGPMSTIGQERLTNPFVADSRFG